MHGMMKKRPGPTAPPCYNNGYWIPYFFGLKDTFFTLPSLKMTALSYSCITLIEKNSEKGKVHTNSKMDKTVKKTLAKLLQMSVSPAASSEFL